MVKLLRGVFSEGAWPVPAGGKTNGGRSSEMSKASLSHPVNASQACGPPLRPGTPRWGLGAAGCSQSPAKGALGGTPQSPLKRIKAPKPGL